MGWAAAHPIFFTITYAYAYAYANDWGWVDCGFVIYFPHIKPRKHSFSFAWGGFTLNTSTIQFA
jgi:hypothetical protein